MRHHHRLTHFLIATGAALGLLFATQVAAAKPVDPVPFASMDTDHDGRLSPAEHAAGARRMFAAIDINRDGHISAAEMDTAHETAAPTPGSVTAQSRIAVYDRDANGVVSADEHAAGSREMFTAMDIDRDGHLSPGELRAGRERQLERVSR